MKVHKLQFDPISCIHQSIRVQFPRVHSVKAERQYARRFEQIVGMAASINTEYVANQLQYCVGKYVAKAIFFLIIEGKNACINYNLCHHKVVLKRDWSTIASHSKSKIYHALKQESIQQYTCQQ